MPTGNSPWDDPSSTPTEQAPDPWGRQPGDPNYGQAPSQGGPTLTSTPAVKPGTTPATTLTPTDPALNWPGGPAGTVNVPAGTPLTPTFNPPAPVTTPTPTTPQTQSVSITGNPTDKAWVQQQVLDTATKMQAAGKYVNPSVFNDPGYWADRIIEKGGWVNNGPQANNIDFFSWRFGLPEGAPELAGELGSGGGTAQPAVQAQPTPLSGQGDQLYQILLARAQPGLHVDPHDPIIRQQADAYDVRQQQSRRQYLSSLAEKEGANANIGAETRASAEQVGQNSADFEGQLMALELTAQRDEIKSALDSAASFLTAEQRMALEAQLAQLTNALQYAQLGQQASQFGQNLGLDYARLGQQGYQYDTTRADNLFGGGGAA